MESERLLKPVLAFGYIMLRQPAHATPASRSRPLIWDSVSRVYDSVPDDGLIRCDFEPTPDNSDTGCVLSDGWLVGG